MNPKLAKIFEGAKVRALVIGGTQHIFIGQEGEMAKADKLVRQALARGESVIEKGVLTRIDFVEVTNPGKSGSEVYIWHSDGNRVKHEKFLVTINNGCMTRKSLGFAWRKLE